MEAGALSRIGLAGLAVMGQNLALNVAEKGFPISVYNRTASRVDETLEPGDCIIDGGNEWYENTERRARQVAEKGLLAVGHVSFKILPHYRYIEDVLNKVAAQVDDGPCVTYVGNGGAGNFVKMVHNGIEYGDMQLISEAYDVLRHVGGLSNQELAETFAEWNKCELESFLVEITADIFTVKDDYGGGELVDKILDKTGMKGTGKWTVQQAAELSVAAPTIAASLDCRYLSGLKEEREAVAKIFKEAGLPDVLVGGGTVDKRQLVDDVRKALYASKICSYAQGMNLLRAKSTEKVWNLNTWRNIIGSMCDRKTVSHWLG